MCEDGSLGGRPLDSKRERGGGGGDGRGTGRLLKRMDGALERRCDRLLSMDI